MITMLITAMVCSASMGQVYHVNNEVPEDDGEYAGTGFDGDGEIVGNTLALRLPDDSGPEDVVDLPEGVVEDLGQLNFYIIYTDHPLSEKYLPPLEAIAVFESPVYLSNGWRVVVNGNFKVVFEDGITTEQAEELLGGYEITKHEYVGDHYVYYARCCDYANAVFAVVDELNESLSVHYALVGVIRVPSAGRQQLPGDANRDQCVDSADLFTVLADWGPCFPNSGCDADMNRDGSVDFVDLLLVLANWS